MDRAVALRVIGVILIFISVGVLPRFGFKPLSTAVPVSFVSATYDPSSSRLYLSADFSVSDYSTAKVYVRLANASQYRVSLPPAYLEVSIDRNASRIYYSYDYSSSYPLVRCVTATGTQPVSGVETYGTFVGAVNNALKSAEQKLGGSLSQLFGDNYRVIVLSYEKEGGFAFFGGQGVAQVMVCGWREDAYSSYRRVGSPDPRLCFRVHLVADNGRHVASTGLICNDAYSSSPVRLVSNGVVVGTVEYRGASSVYVPPFAYSDVPQALFSEAYDVNSTSVKGFFAADPQVLSQYGSRASALISVLRELPSRVYSVSGPVSSVAVDQYSDYGYTVGDYSATISQVRNYYGDVSALLDSLRSHPLVNTVFRISKAYPNSVVLYEPYTRDYEVHNLFFALDANFLGLRFVRPEPHIVAVSSPSCTSVGCTVEVRLRNQSSDAGTVVVSARGRYFFASTTVSLPPNGTAVAKLFGVPSVSAKSLVSDDLTVTALAPHPVSPYRDVYHYRLVIQPVATCSVASPTCGSDANGMYYVYCPSPYSSPEKVYCKQGYTCVDGKGCVLATVSSVKCTSISSYAVQYSGGIIKSGVCAPGEVCSPALAAKGTVPPCTDQNVCALYPALPQCAGVSKVSTVSVAAYDVRRSKQMIALGVLLLGIGMVVMPWRP